MGLLKHLKTNSKKVPGKHRKVPFLLWQLVLAGCEGFKLMEMNSNLSFSRYIPEHFWLEVGVEVRPNTTHIPVTFHEHFSQS